MGEGKLLESSHILKTKNLFPFISLSIKEKEIKGRVLFASQWSCLHYIYFQPWFKAVKTNVQHAAWSVTNHFSCIFIWHIRWFLLIWNWFLQQVQQGIKSRLLIWEIIARDRRMVLNLIMVRKMKNENKNCTILIPKGNSYCRRKSSAYDHD